MDDVESDKEMSNCDENASDEEEDDQSSGESSEGESGDDDNDDGTEAISDEEDEENVDGKDDETDVSDDDDDDDNNKSSGAMGGGDDEDGDNLSLEDPDMSCPICLNGFVGQDLGSPENCSHTFCLECIVEWSKNVNTCPIDRIEFHLIYVKQEINGDVMRKVKVRMRKKEEEYVEEVTLCEVCRLGDREDRLLLCDSCDSGYHCECLDPPLETIPIEEWFCPPCSRVMRERGQSSHSSHSRLIARTSASEIVRSRIQNHRAASDDSGNDTPLPRIVRSPARSPTKRKTTRRKTRRKTSRKSSKSKTTKARTKATSSGKTKSKSKTKSPIKRRRKGRKRKSRKTKKKSKRSWLASMKLVAPSVKKRIADHLGLCKPPPGHTMPYVKKSGGQRSSVVESVPSLDVLGCRDQLFDFGASYAEGDVDDPRPSTSKVGSSLRYPNGLASCSGLNLLDNILENQNVLLRSSKSITIGKDGSLNIKEKSLSLSAKVKHESKSFRVEPVKETGSNEGTSSSSVISKKEGFTTSSTDAKHKENSSARVPAVNVGRESRSPPPDHLSACKKTSRLGDSSSRDVASYHVKKKERPRTRFNDVDTIFTVGNHANEELGGGIADEKNSNGPVVYVKEEEDGSTSSSSVGQKSVGRESQSPPRDHLSASKKTSRLDDSSSRDVVSYRIKKEERPRVRFNDVDTIFTVGNCANEELDGEIADEKNSNGPSVYVEEEEDGSTSGSSVGQQSVEFESRLLFETLVHVKKEKDEEIADEKNGNEPSVYVKEEEDSSTSSSAVGQKSVKFESPLLFETLVHIKKEEHIDEDDHLNEIGDHNVFRNAGQFSKVNIGDDSSSLNGRTEDFNGETRDSNLSTKKPGLLGDIFEKTPFKEVFENASASKSMWAKSEEDPPPKNDQRSSAKNDQKRHLPFSLNGLIRPYKIPKLAKPKDRTSDSKSSFISPLILSNCTESKELKVVESVSTTEPKKEVVKQSGDGDLNCSAKKLGNSNTRGGPSEEKVTTARAFPQKSHGKGHSGTSSKTALQKMEKCLPGMKSERKIHTDSPSNSRTGSLELPKSADSVEKIFPLLSGETKGVKRHSWTPSNGIECPFKIPKASNSADRSAVPEVNTKMSSGHLDFKSRKTLENVAEHEELAFGKEVKVHSTLKMEKFCIEYALTDCTDISTSDVQSNVKRNGLLHASAQSKLNQQRQDNPSRISSCSSLLPCSPNLSHSHNRHFAINKSKSDFEDSVGSHQVTLQISTYSSNKHPDKSHSTSLKSNSTAKDTAEFNSNHKHSGKMLHHGITSTSSSKTFSVEKRTAHLNSSHRHSDKKSLDCGNTSETCSAENSSHRHSDKKSDDCSSTLQTSSAKNSSHGHSDKKSRNTGSTSETCSAENSSHRHSDKKSHDTSKTSSAENSSHRHSDKKSRDCGSTSKTSSAEKSAVVLNSGRHHSDKKSHSSFSSVSSKSYSVEKHTATLNPDLKSHASSPEAALKTSSVQNGERKNDDDDRTSMQINIQLKVRNSKTEKVPSKHNLKESIAAEVKKHLKDFYTTDLITKEEYKEIMRRTVPKVLQNCKNSIDSEKIRKLVVSYVHLIGQGNSGLS